MRPELRGEIFQCDRAFGKIIREEFQGDVAAESDVFRFVDHAHATAAELSNDPVMGDDLVDHSVCNPPTQRFYILRTLARLVKSEVSMRGQGNRNRGGSLWLLPSFPLVTLVIVPPGNFVPLAGVYPY